MSERGSLLLGTLFLAVLVALSLSGLIFQIDTARQFHVRTNARNHANDVRTTLQMILSSRSVCTTNLTATAFGTNMAEIQTRSATGQTQVVLPNPVPLGLPIILAANSKFNRFHINKITFGPATPVFAPDPAWQMDLSLEVTPPGAPLVRNLVIPFYFEADGTGTLFSCQATTRPGVRGAGTLTVEDELCYHWDHTKRYRHVGRFCLAGP